VEYIEIDIQSHLTSRISTKRFEFILNICVLVLMFSSRSLKPKPSSNKYSKTTARSHGSQLPTCIDEGLYDVASVISHRGNIKKPCNLRFLVRWAGYGPEADSELPWSELRNNILLHRYLLAHNMGPIIPPEFCENYRRELVAPQQQHQQMRSAQHSMSDARNSSAALDLVHHPPSDNNGPSLGKQHLAESPVVSAPINPAHNECGRSSRFHCSSDVTFLGVKPDGAILSPPNHPHNDILSNSSCSSGAHEVTSSDLPTVQIAVGENNSISSLVTASGLQDGEKKSDTTESSGSRDSCDENPLSSAADVSQISTPTTLHLQPRIREDRVAVEQQTNTALVDVRRDVKKRPLADVMIKQGDKYKTNKLVTFSGRNESNVGSDGTDGDDEGVKYSRGNHKRSRKMSRRHKHSGADIANKRRNESVQRSLADISTVFLKAGAKKRSVLFEVQSDDSNTDSDSPVSNGKFKLLVGGAKHKLVSLFFLYVQHTLCCERFSGQNLPTERPNFK
jgi:hypothetical protein